MKLTREASAILGRASIGMLALRSGRLPLVNPAVYSYAIGSLWMTTSRFAAKPIIVKRGPRARRPGGGQPAPRRRRARLCVLDRRRPAHHPPRLLGGRAWSGHAGAHEWTSTLWLAGCPGGRIAPQLPTFTDGRRMRARHVHSIERRRCDRRALRHRRFGSPTGHRPQARASHVVARICNHDRGAATRAAAARRRRPERSMLSSSACGVCGAVLIEDLRRDLAQLPAGPTIDPALLPPLVERLRSGQGVFERTGGLHAAGLFSSGGDLICMREDIGRHNAVDKVVGRMLLDGRLPARDTILVVSGRAGYEIVQKSITAGMPLLAAVGAPSSLAVA